jgi:phosphatidylglycerophosphatase A
MKPTWRNLREPDSIIALSFGAGLVPFSPGTAGALVAMPLAWFVLQLPVLLQVVSVSALFVIGVVCAGRFGRRFGHHDHPAIVWDETVAMLAILLILPVEPASWLAGLLAFRFFDIVKPWPIRLVDAKLKGGLGVMADDLAAAAPSAALVCAFLHFL